MTTHQMPSYELKLRRSAWAAGSPPRTPLGELTALLRPPSSIKGRYFDRGRNGGEGRGSKRKLRVC